MMKQKEKLLYSLIKNKKPLEAPQKTTRHGKHYEFIIGIGKDHIANITMTTEAFVELNKMREKEKKDESKE